MGGGGWVGGREGEGGGWEGGGIAGSLASSVPPVASTTPDLRLPLPFDFIFVILLLV